VISSAFFTEFFFGYQAVLFHLTDFTGWQMETGLLASSKPDGIAAFNTGSVFIACLFLILTWIFFNLLSRTTLRALYPKTLNRQPGVSMWRFETHWILIGSVILLLILGAGLFPQLLTSHTPNQEFWMQWMIPPNRQFPFGTDDITRDIFAEVLYGTPRTLALVAITAVSTLLFSLSLAICSVGFESRWLRKSVEFIGGAIAPLPVLIILFLAMFHRNLNSPMQAVQYVIWITLWEGVRGGYAFQTAMQSWFEFSFVEGMQSIGQSRFAIILKGLRPWLARFMLEFISAEFVRIFALMVELAAFHVYPTDRIGEVPYTLSYKAPLGLIDGHLTWFSLIGPVTTQYAYMTYPFVLFGPGIAIIATVIGAGLIAKGFRGKPQQV
jgi:ABC-type dipeptide/oligopeptide/nickel transport system permease subunit